MGISENKVVAVTGSSGYIGRVLVRKLLEHGHDVICIDLVPFNHEIPNKNNKVYQYVGNFANHYPWLSHLSALHSIGELVGVVHLAANSLLGPSVKAPLPYFMNNVGNSTKFLDFLVTREIYTTFVSASSAAVYGDRRTQEPIVFGDSCYPCNPYGLTKLHFEHVLTEAAVAHGFYSTSFRFFNVVGGYGNLGQPIDQPHIITSLLRARQNNVSFEMRGIDYPTLDGTPIRDYIHVLDVCRAIITRLETRNEYYDPHEIHNLGSGIGTSNLQLFHAFESRVARGLNYTVAAKRPGDPAYLVADCSTYFPWEPVHSSMDEIIYSATKAYEWMANNNNEKKVA